MTPESLAAKIDHTILKPEATAAEVEAVIVSAIKYRFASVCVAPVWVHTVSNRLEGTGVLTCTVTSFPHGTSKPIIKAIEASSSVKDGADEIDVVAHLPTLARHDLAGARAELLEVARACRAARPTVVVKVIVESAYLLSLGRLRAKRRSPSPAGRYAKAGVISSKPVPGFTRRGGLVSRQFG